METTTDIPREKLRQIVEKNGEAVLEDHDRVEGLLRDHCGAYRKEISALVGALAERVPVELRSSWQTAMTPEAMRSRLVQRLEDNRGLAPNVADWAVEAWSYALGIGLGRRSDRLDSVVIGHDSSGVAAAGVAGLAGGAALESFGSSRAGGDRIPSNFGRDGSERNGLASDRVVSSVAAVDAAQQAHAAEQKKKAGIGVGLLVAILAISALAYHRHIAATPTPEPIPTPTPKPVPQPTPTPTPTPGPTVTTGTVAAGTSLDIRLNQALNSDEDTVGQTFTGTVVSPLHLNGSTIVPQGANALVKVMSIDKAGKLSGRATMQLELAQVSSGGKHYPVSTSLKAVQGPKQAVEAAKRGGIGSAVGAAGGFVVGHLFHHGAAGAGAGAGAGAVAGIATTKPKPATLSAESIVRFKLTKPLTVN